MNNIQQIIVTIAWISLGILLFFIFYRILLKKLKGKKLQKERYLFLYPMEKQPVSGEITIYFEMHTPLEVEVSIFPKDESSTLIIEHKTFKKGGNVIHFDTKKLENGWYFYQTKTPFQKNKKLIEVVN